MTDGHRPPHLQHQHHQNPQSQPRPRSYIPLPPPTQNARQPYRQYGHEDPSLPYPLTGGNYTTSPHDRFEDPAPKRQRLSLTGDRLHAVTGPGRRSSQSAFTPRHPLGSGNPPPLRMEARHIGPRRGNSPLRSTQPGSGPAAGGRGPTAASGHSPVRVIKSRRVRTGCLTCRERHLKCDEGIPDCLNCRKSNRECKRGVRLNFIDVQVKTPPTIPPTAEWKVDILDESREIASEYQGGLARYGPKEIEDDLRSSIPSQRQSNFGQPAGPRPGAGSRAPLHDNFDSYFGGRFPRPLLADEPGRGETASPSPFQSRRDNDALPAISSEPTPTSTHSADARSGLPAGFEPIPPQNQSTPRDEPLLHSHTYKPSDGSSVASSLVPQGVAPSSSDSPRAPAGSGAPNPPDGLITPVSENTSGEREYLNSEEEMYYMQVFVEQVGIWMDVMDHHKHFGRVIPFLALKSPMLLNAFLACGVKHLTLVNGAQQQQQQAQDRALFYYDTATTQLLRSLQNPDRSRAECATTAVVLNVYDVMSDTPAARKSHIAGARALVRECGWDARSSGVGAACFWLNVGMEVITCLASNWQTAWDPDDWGLDVDVLLNMTDDRGGDRMSLGGDGEEELWVQRIFYILAKVANFRANTPPSQEPSPHDEQVRLQTRFAEWKRLKGLCDAWNNKCPRPMRPYGYLFASQSRTQSAFPHVWLIKRAAIVGRLFYHTAMCLLAQVNPLSPRDTEENRAIQQHHAHQVCGIVAHTTDRGVSSVAVRCLAIAAAVLTDRREQDEATTILERVGKDTGWRLGSIREELERAWDRGDTLGPGAGARPAMGLHPPPPVQVHESSAGGPAQVHGRQQGYAAPSLATTGQPSAEASAPVGGWINPFLATADFRLPEHPYRGWYVPPNETDTFNSHGLWQI